MRLVWIFRLAVIAVTVAPAASAAELAAAPQVLAQAADEVSPYDAGYAFAASQKCPGATLLLPLGPEAQANEQFKRGMAMFERYVTAQTTEGACKAALNLYNDQTGKVAKILHLK